MTITTINPATGAVLEEYQEFTAAQVESALSEAVAAHRANRDWPMARRQEGMRRAAAQLREHAERFARGITAEMGKPIVEARAEIQKCATACEHYADNAETYLAEVRIATNARESYVAYRPLGVLLAIMPWNYPFWQVIRCLVPALMAGNAVLLKHASNVPGCALMLEEVFGEAGFPAGACRAVLIPSSRIPELIEDPRIAAVTLTGSEAAGCSVAATAGRALKKAVLELGGSDPYIVLADADLDLAVDVAVRARYQNTGQSCIAAKRFIVVDEIADAFGERFVEAVARLEVGDPMLETTRVGPLARADLRDDLDRQVQGSVDAGARVATGGHRLESPGFFYAPSVLLDVRPDMPAFREEVFGPVAAVIRARSTEEAIATANDSAFGLGSSLWTRDVDRARALAGRIESGQVFINGMTASDPRLPFGGVKRSGHGRELSWFGMQEFVNVQTVWIGPAA